MTPSDSNTNDLKKGLRICLWAAGATLLLACLKAYTGIVFDSEILVADAFHSYGDLLAISASGFGLWLASRKKSRRFPYGLYKAETLATFIIGLLIVWAGIEVLRDGYNKLFVCAALQKFPVFPASVSSIAVFAAYFIAKKERQVGRLINSQSLEANASESFLDIGTSLMVLCGIMLAYAKIPYVEGAIIIFIALLILKLGGQNIWRALLILLDANLDPLLQAEIEEKIQEFYGVKGVSKVMIRQAGPFKMIECKIETSPTLALYRAHELADKAEECIMTTYKHIDSVFIHVEPAKNNILSAIIPVHDINGLDSKVHGHFGRAPYFIILKISGTDVSIDDFYCNEFLKEKKHIGVKVIRAIIKNRLDLLFCSQIGEISFYMLKNNFVDIYKVEDSLSVQEVMEKYYNQQLPLITAPSHSLEESLAEQVSG
ncbi:MAG: cation diffusion facilitator family transporter [Deltaproteobacteria bacterium]|nr:cation diffusion facilitator family transporter [Deltaproteobacteria bacterium]